MFNCVGALAVFVAFSSLPAARINSTPQESVTASILADQTLMEVLSNWAAASGISLIFEDAIEARLTSSQCGLLVDASMPNEQLGVFVESLLSINGVELTESELNGQPALIAHDALGPQRFETARVVQSLKELKSHPARRLRIAQTFDGINVQQVPALLRLLRKRHRTLSTTEPGILQLEGPGVLIHDLASILHTIHPERVAPDLSIQPESLFDPVSSPLVVEALTTCLEVVQAYDNLTNLHVAITDEAREELRTRQFTSETKTIPSHKVHSFISQMLFEAGMSTSIPCNELPIILAIHSAQQEPWARRFPANFSAREDFDRQPSFVVFIPVEFQNASARFVPIQLIKLMPRGLQLRKMDSPPLTIESDCILLTGRAGDLAETWENALTFDK